MESSVEKARGNILHSVLHLHSLSRLIATQCEGRIDFMFLGNDERENIQAAELLLGDNVIGEFAGNSGKVISIAGRESTASTVPSKTAAPDSG